MLARGEGRKIFASAGDCLPERSVVRVSPSKHTAMKMKLNSFDDGDFKGERGGLVWCGLPNPKSHRSWRWSWSKSGTGCPR